MRRTLALSIILLTSCSVTVPVRTTDRSLAVLAICSRVPYLAAAYDGSMTFQVNDAIQTRDSINALVDEVTGYFSYERRHNGMNVIMYDVTITAPSSSISRLMSSVEKLAVKVLVHEQKITDVTNDILKTETLLVNKMVAKSIRNDIEFDHEIDSVRRHLNGLCAGTLHRKLELHFYQRL